MELKIYPDHMLRVEAGTLLGIDDKIKYVERRIADLKDSMKELGGIGLASVQIGRLYPIFVFESQQFDKIMAVVNPNIVWCEGKCKDVEACLSVPGYSAVIERPAIIGMKYFDIEKKEVVFCEFGGRDARVIQHENDHLNGTLFIDHLSSLKRRMFEKKYAKMQKQGRIPKC